MLKNKKTISCILALLLIFTQSLANWVFYDTKNTVSAASPTEENKLIAIFVEKDLYQHSKNNIERYALQYIQARLPRTKALVFPVDKNISAHDVQKILSNLYFGGEKDTPSSLIGTILIGSVPLPIIKQDATIFPSIIPYTDLEKPSYIFDSVSGYFGASSTSVDNRQELFHGIISFSTNNEYDTYFEKIKKYISDPTSFAEQKFRFDDFKKLQETYTDQNSPLYAKSQIYEEDISYHRFSPALFDLLQGDNTDDALHTINQVGSLDLQTNISTAEYSSEFNEQSKAFTDTLGAWQGNIVNQSAAGQAALSNIGGADQIPTKLMGPSVSQQIKTYNTLFSAEYGDTIKKEITRGGRWTDVDIGSHISKVALFDEASAKMLFTINARLEQVLDKKIEDEKFSLHIPIPVLREKYQCADLPVLGYAPIPITPANPGPEKQEVFYFGKNAWDITNADQTTRYRGTYGNITDATTVKSLPWTDIGASVGATFGFSAQQVTASRGYNILAAKTDANAYEDYWMDHCGESDDAEVSFKDYIKYFWGGNTAVNIDGDTQQLKSDNWELAYNPSYDRTIGGALFDIAGSVLTTGNIALGSNALAAQTFGRFLKVGAGLAWGNGGMKFGIDRYPWCKPKNPVPVSIYDFFNVVANPSGKDIQIVSSGSTAYNGGATCDERLIYKTINSIVKHTSPTEEEINGMNIVTQARPIDTKRYISFQGLGGGIVNLSYPNLYAVDVYKKSGEAWELKSASDIKTAIITYLEGLVDTYNNALAVENNNISSYLTTNSVGFGMLAKSDEFASPAGRQYATLPKDFYTSALGDNVITQLADILYVKNTPWSTKITENTVGGTIASLQANMNIQNKINAVLERNIVVGEDTIGTATTGYEAGYIRSFGTDTIGSSNAVPTAVQQADAHRNNNATKTTPSHSLADAQQQFIDATCSVGEDGTVPLLKRPSALSCWWKNLKNTTLKSAVKISYKNAQGPVYPLSQFKDVLTESYTNYADYVNNVLGKDLTSQTKIGSITIDAPTVQIIRGAQIPLSLTVKSKDDEVLSNLLFPLEVTTSTGEFLTPGQAIPRIETTAPYDPIILDTSVVDRSINTITVTVSGENAPAVSKDFRLVDGTLRTHIDGVNDNVTLSLSDTGYNKTNAGIPTIIENALPTLAVRLTDNDNRPITSAATVTSQYGLLQPCAIIAKQEESAVGLQTSKQCSLQQLRTITGGALDIKLLPTMKAGKDRITISVPGLPDRYINVTIEPSKPYTVHVLEDASLASNNSSNGARVRFVAQDKWGNSITKPTIIQYSLLGDITNTAKQKQGVLTISSSGGTLPIAFGTKGGVNYIYGSLGGVSSGAQQPGYLRKDTPAVLWPQYNLNIVYLTLAGKNWGDINTSIIPDMITSSSKLITVSSSLYDKTKEHPVIALINTNGEVLEDNEKLVVGTGFTANLSLSIASAPAISTNSLGVKKISSIANIKKPLIYNGKTIGYLLGNGPYTLDTIIIEDPSYGKALSWAGGSSNMQAIAITNTTSSTSEEEKEDFSPLRSYAGGVSVGEARKQIFDLAAVTYGDPLLQHAGATTPLKTEQTEVTIFQDDKNTIKKVMELDIDNDGRRDMVILYDNDTIRFLKKYGGNPPYTPLGNLMAIADGVDDMWIGDADGNGLEDIFIKTKKQTLRVYKNMGGSFDVNGNPICLDVPSGDTALTNIWDLYIEDMNRDNRADIITNDTRGQIRIFYGGGAGGNTAGAYYVSANPQGCDVGWQNRQKDNNITVATFGLNLNQGSHIYDDSLVHWKGLTLPDDNTSPNVDPDDLNPTVPASISNAFPNPEDPSSINIQALISAGLSDTVRYTATPYDKAPSYEGITLDNIAYIPSRHLTGNDVVETYKTFSYGSGDDIIVTVHIKAKVATQATYIEQLRGPWSITKETDGSIANFSGGTLPSASTIDWNPGDEYQFMIDNISLTAGQEVSFSYPVRYVPTQTVRISVQDTNNDNWLDIITTPLDGCMPFTYTYRSEAGKSYTPIQNTVKNTTIEDLQTVEAGVKDLVASISSGVDSAENGGEMNIPGLNDVVENRDNDGKLLENLGNMLNNGVNVNANVSLDLDKMIGIDTKKAEATINKLLQGACKGFSAGGGGGSGIPVPFNVAFLCPGPINVFGQKVFDDKGLPAFFFPGTLTTPAGTIPFPYGLKGATDSFYWAAGGVYPSMIRIYVAPTLTMSVGVAICFGPMTAGTVLPSPIKHIAGNCIVIAKKPGTIGKKNNGGQPDINDGSTYWDDSNTNTADQNVCKQPFSNNNTTNTRPSSPISMGVVNGKLDASSMDPTKLFSSPSSWTPGGSQASTYGNLGYTNLGVTEIDSVPYATQRGQDAINNDTLKGGKPINLKIQGGSVKGLIKCIVNKWLDNQIRYIVNNLTTMSINIYLPDLTQIAEGFEKLDFNELNKVVSDFQKNGQSNTPAGEIVKNLTSKTKGENSALPSKSDVSDISSITSNPFNALSARFEQVPLININTKNVVIQVPFIYDEEITRYSALLENRGKQAEKDLGDWTKIIEDLTGQCKKKESQIERNACNEKVAQYVDIQTKIGQMQTSVRKNIQTLQAYKQFPSQLQQRLTISQRYTTEISDTVQGVSSDLTAWLNTNANRFSKYVDTIILMIGAVKSWQAIIDFSVNRKSKCGQCTVDNYDYYSCTLGLLCPNLPILAIPPFKLPNVYIDLSHITLGMDVLLPNVQFVPKSIALPALPTLPQPPTITADLTIGYKADIPNIPELPAPPQLPELPSFIPSIDLNLPTLPPAPKVPNLSPAITSTLKVAGIVSKILCIVKNGIGLVGEKGVKTRIEQLTQRTRNVAPFDSLSITSVQPPLRGFDLKVDTYVTFEMNFDGLYSIIDDVAKKINKQTNALLSKADKEISAVSSGSMGISQDAQNAVDKANISTQGSLGIDGFKGSYVAPEDVEPEVLRENLLRELTAFKDSEYAETYTTQIAAIEKIITSDASVTPNYEGIQNAAKTLQDMFIQSNANLEQYKQHIRNDYNGFLDKINTAALVSDNNIAGTINTSLYVPQQETKTIIEGAENPMSSYLDLQEDITDGFLNAMKTHNAASLNMGEFTFNKLFNFFSTTKEEIQTIKGIITPKQETDIKNDNIDLQSFIAPSVQAANIAPTTNTLGVSNNSTTALSNTPAITSTSTEQPSTVAINNKNLTNVIIPVTTAEEGVIWRDSNHIYTNQKTYLAAKNDRTRFARFYVFNPISSFNDLSTKADSSGYIKLFNSYFYVRNKTQSVTSFEAKGQSNTNVTVRRLNSGQSLYILELRKTIYANHDYISANDVERKYIVAYTSGVDLGNTYIDIPGLPNKKIDELIGHEIMYTIPFDNSNEEITMPLDLAGDRWSYIRLAQAQSTDRAGTDLKTMRLISTWSSLETLGVQRWGDNTPPIATAEIINKDNGAVIAEGNLLTVPRRGNYSITIKWTDDGEVAKNSTQRKDTTTINSFVGSEGKIDTLPGDRDEPIIYFATAEDQAKNLGSQTVTIRFEDPLINIDTVIQNTDQREIISSLSTNFPNGYVRFFTDRSGSPTVLTGVTGSEKTNSFNTQEFNQIVTGGVFFDADTISLFSSTKERIATIDKNTAKITIATTRKDRLVLSLDTTQNTPILLFRDKQNGLTLFSLYLRSTKLIQAVSLNNLYTITPMSDDTIGTFAGGQCIKDGSCVVYIAKDGNLYMPDNMKARAGGRYEYNGGVRYIITIDGKDAAIILFTPEIIAQ